MVQSNGQLSEEVSRLAGELEAAKADAEQHAGKAADAEQASSQHASELARLRQEHEAGKQALRAEASSTGSRLAAAEASLAEAQQLAAALQDAAAEHDGEALQGAEGLAALEVLALPGLTPGTACLPQRLPICQIRNSSRSSGLLLNGAGGFKQGAQSD